MSGFLEKRRTNPAEEIFYSLRKDVRNYFSYEQLGPEKFSSENFLSNPERIVYEFYEEHKKSLSKICDYDAGKDCDTKEYSRATEYLSLVLGI